MAITSPPQPPLPTDDEATFSARAAAWLDWQYASAPEFNALQQDVVTRQADVADKHALTVALAESAQQSRDICQAIQDDPDVKNAAANADIAAAAAASASADAALLDNYTDIAQPVRLHRQRITSDFTVPADHNAISAGPIAIDSEATVTVQPGATWTVI